MTRPPSPYLAKGFYDDALAQGRHREIVGGRWDETGRVQMAALLAAGMEPHHKLVDIGAGAMRLGCKAVPYLQAGNYWATDASLPLMQRGRMVELPDPARLPEHHLIEDADFTLPRIPPDIDFAICFGVLTHLPPDVVARAFVNLRAPLSRVRVLLVTLFTAPEPDGPHRQPDGVVTHAGRPPYHLTHPQIEAMAQAAGWDIAPDPMLLPRGQRLFHLTPAPETNHPSRL